MAPFPGAETGTGGRIRDVQATGTGGLVVAGTAAYCVGNLRIPGYELPWEDASYAYPNNLASPLQIEVEASNGASDYGNKFGEPVIQGFTRSFGLRLPDGERREWLKPIMFSAGIGQMDARHTKKTEAQKGMLVVKVGGPAYRIGMGGGAASSMIQGENIAELDFNAVQRGDAEMEQKMNRVIRACVELGEKNPIQSIHDQGAGGNCNVVKEIVHPAGAKIEIRKIQVGDNTLSVLEIWGAEYQEQNALLLKPEHEALVPFALRARKGARGRSSARSPATATLCSMMRSTTRRRRTSSLPRCSATCRRRCSRSTGKRPSLKPLELPKDLTVRKALDRVLRLVSVGLQAVPHEQGRPLGHGPDRPPAVRRPAPAYGVRRCRDRPVPLRPDRRRHLHRRTAGKGTDRSRCHGQDERGRGAHEHRLGKGLRPRRHPLLGKLDVGAEASGRRRRLYDAAVAMRDVMIEFGMAVDGGKDSLSMAAKVTNPDGTHETVKSPGTLVISAYVTCPDITKTVTPDLKAPGKSKLLFIDLGNGQNRLGGSALAQVFGQVGDTSPDLDDPQLLTRTFNAVQKLVADRADPRRP